MNVRKLIAMAGIGAVIGVMALAPMLLCPGAGSTVKQAYTGLFKETLLDPVFYIGFGALLCLEWFLPAVPSQRLFSVGLAHDLIWLMIFTSLQLGSLAAWVIFLQSQYIRYLSFLTVHAAASWPALCRLLAAFVIADATNYLGHWLRHRVSWLWYFHSVHHSQRELNAFTDYRYHIVDYLIGGTIHTLPMFIFAMTVPQAVIYTAVLHWYSRLYHANIRTNFGPLRWILVTPQSHRIHHSLEPRHYDKNFGALTCLWDRLFGTFYGRADEYPATGIADDQFPLERSFAPSELVLSPIRQHIYPLRLFARAKVAPHASENAERRREVA